MFNPLAEVADSDSTDKELVERAANGHRDALEKLVTVVRMCERWLTRTSA